MKQPNEISNMNQPDQRSQLDISAWMDGDQDTEMPAALKSPQGQADWDLYHLIGDALRTPELALPVAASLHQRIAQELANEPAIVAAPKPQAASSQKIRFWTKAVWPGVAMAAAVASVIWVAKPFLLPEFSGSVEQVAETTPTPVAPTEVAMNTPVVRDYVTAHRQISGPANVRQVSFGATR